MSPTMLVADSGGEVPDSDKESCTKELAMLSTPEKGKRQFQGTDEVDALKRNTNVTLFDLAWIAVSIITYFCDLGTDVYVAYKYFTEKDYWYFAFTVTFVSVPAITMTILSLKWYLKDWKNPNESPPVSVARWIFRGIFLSLQLSPVIRYIDSLYYGWVSRKAHKAKKPARNMQYFIYMTSEDADATLLRLFECFMEAAPQLVLQLYILARRATNTQDDEDPWTITVQTAVIISSDVSLAWALASYHRAVRYARRDKLNISCAGTSVQFLGYLCSISSRMLALSLFASVDSMYRLYIWAVVAGHWCLMLGWILLQEANACSTRIGEFVFSLVLAVIHIFTFFSVKEGDTRCKYIFYYVVCFLENTALMVLWFLAADPTLWFRIPAFVGHFVAFFCGVVFLSVYYTFLHPVKRHSRYDTSVSEKMPSALHEAMVLDVAKVTHDTSQIDDSLENTLDIRTDDPL